MKYICTLLLSLMLSACEVSSSTTKVVAYGDSNTEQINISDTEKWTALLSSHFPSFNIVNAGHGGATSKYGVDNVSKITRLKPIKVFIMFGTNDAVMKATDTPAISHNDFRANLRQMVNAIRAAGSYPILMTTIPLIEGDAKSYYYSRHPAGWYSMGARQWHNSYNMVVREESQFLRTPLVDINTAIVSKAGGDNDTSLILSGLIDSSGTHLSAKGSKVVALAVISAIK